ncbi:TPA: hypothetical protein DDW35_05125, partial [Candidatus Sumerlaeota bacterium]|nr:hypothetical protein [Candidatus Sumerlaeota bacterium]
MLFSRFPQTFFCLAFFTLAIASPALAQRINFVYPAGGQQGTNVRVTLGGQGLVGVHDVRVSGSGVEGTIESFTKPPSGKEVEFLRDRQKELQARKQATRPGAKPPVPAKPTSGTLQTNALPSTLTVPLTSAEEQEFLDIRKKLATFQKRRNSPAFSDSAVVTLSIAPNAEPGMREIRLDTPNGLSNPLAFCVSQLPEMLEGESVEGEDDREMMMSMPDGQSNLVKMETHVTIPSTINGRIMPGNVDYFRFAARKGQHLVINVNARALLPYLADAVPGWFQPTIALYDAKGKELAYDDDFRFNIDPVLYYEVPTNGEYVLEIKDSIYRGREDFVYRITVSENPFITSIFPLGCKMGDSVQTEIKGWNLPQSKLTQSPKQAGILNITETTSNKLVSNRAPFAVDTLPEVNESEPNNMQTSAQAVKLPIIINGRIDKPGDWDVFRFEGKAGEQIVAEVMARRLNSPLDSIVRLTDANGKQIAINDDSTDKGAGLTTHHADSLATATLPTAGTYYLYLGDVQHAGGPEYGYRLRISNPQPNFELRVVPSALNVRQGASVPFTVYALRRDGFTGEIALQLKDLTTSFTLSGAKIPANQDSIKLTLKAPAARFDDPIALHLEGSAAIAGKNTVHPAVPAEDMQQAFSYHHLVPAQEFLVNVLARGAGKNEINVITPIPIKIPAGKSAAIQLVPANGSVPPNVTLKLNDPMDGITLQGV